MLLYDNISWEHIKNPEWLSWGWIFFGSESNIFYQQLIYSFIYEFPKLIAIFLFADSPIYSILSSNLFLLINYLIFSFIFISNCSTPNSTINISNYRILKIINRCNN